MASWIIRGANKYGPLTEGRLAEFDAKPGCRLPDDYRAVLLTYNGGKPDPAGFHHPPFERDHVTSHFGISRLLVVLGIMGIICACLLISVAAFTLLYQSMVVAPLPEACMRENPGMDRAACDAWIGEVSQKPVYSACLQEEMDGGNPYADHLYACLVDNGVGPD